MDSLNPDLVITIHWWTTGLVWAPDSTRPTPKWLEKTLKMIQKCGKKSSQEPAKDPWGIVWIQFWWSPLIWTPDCTQPASKWLKKTLKMVQQCEKKSSQEPANNPWRIFWIIQQLVMDTECIESRWVNGKWSSCLVTAILFNWNTCRVLPTQTCTFQAQCKRQMFHFRYVFTLLVAEMNAAFNSFEFPAVSLWRETRNITN